MKTHKISVTPKEFHQIMTGRQTYVIVMAAGKDLQAADFLKISPDAMSSIELAARVSSVEPVLIAHIDEMDEELTTEHMLIACFKLGLDL